jgi:hypothetical protein
MLLRNICACMPKYLRHLYQNTTACILKYLRVYTKMSAHVYKNICACVPKYLRMHTEISAPLIPKYQRVYIKISAREHQNICPCLRKYLRIYTKYLHVYTKTSAQAHQNICACIPKYLGINTKISANIFQNTVWLPDVSTGVSKPFVGNTYRVKYTTCFSHSYCKKDFIQANVTAQRKHLTFEMSTTCDWQIKLRLKLQHQLETWCVS